MALNSHNFSVSLQKSGLKAFLNDAESDILSYLWEKQGSYVKEVHGAVKGNHRLSHVTVCIYLDRLFQKGLVDRKPMAGKGGLKYWYFPKVSREEFGKTLAHRLAEVVRGSFGSSTATYFAKESAHSAKASRKANK